MSRTIDLPVRWYPTITPPEVPCREPNGCYLEKTWPLALDQTALVLVDCWDTHEIETHLENSGAIIEAVIRPLLDACRESEVAVVHAPSPAQAKLYPEWVRYAGDEELGHQTRPRSDDPAWPPAAFRQRTGEWEPLARPSYLRDVTASLAERRIVESIEPAGDDYVIATGDQLHRLLRDKGILHLLYVGFATNMCILFRDYGIERMHQRGYNCILLRDGTIGIEAAHTYDGKRLTEAAIVTVEMLFGVSSTAAEFLAALG